MLKVSCLAGGRFDATESKRVPIDQIPNLASPVRKGKVIISRSNTPELVGLCAYVSVDHPNLFLPDTLWQMEFSEGRESDPRWLAYLLNSPSYRERLSRIASGTSANMKKLQKPSLLRLTIRVPPLPQQRKIAEILRTWDEGIEKLGELRIAKLRRYGALTKRFFDPCHPAFQQRSDSWREFELGNVFRERIQTGEEGDMLLSITMSEGVINRNDVGRKDTSNEDKSRYKLILPGDIGYNTMRMWQGVSGLSMLRGIVSPAYTIVTPDNRDIATRYAAHLFKSRRMVFDFQRYSQGLSSDTWNLKFPAFSKIKVFLPPVEQKEKQAELFDMLRQEITALERQSKTLTRQKRGLMQKLLTGK